MHRCNKCHLEFQKKRTLEQHIQYIHKSDFPSVKKILILGGGFGGVNILRDIQKMFQDKVNVDISIVNQENFFLFTPMLPEVASGMIHPRDISIPIRTFCKRAKFYQAVVSSIDLEQKLMTFTVVGGGFAGVETIGELNHLIRESASRMYPNINREKINMVLVSSKNGILPEVSESLSKKAMKYLKNHGVNVLTNTKAIDADEDNELLENNKKIPCTTLIWTGGGTVYSFFFEFKSE